MKFPRQSLRELYNPEGGSVLEPLFFVLQATEVVQEWHPTVESDSRYTLGGLCVWAPESS